MATDTGRKYLNAESTAELLAQWRRSGLTLKEFFQSQGLNELTLTRWLRRMTASKATREVTPAFVPVQSMMMEDITVHAQGVSIQVPATLLEQSLPAILRALRC